MNEVEEACCLAVRRYNCNFDKAETEQWKKWVVDIQRPIEYVLTITLLVAGFISALGTNVFAYYMQAHGGNAVYRVRELFVIRGEISALLIMALIYLIGHSMVMKKYPRPRVERCLEVHYCRDYFSLYYIYRRHKHKEFIKKISYDSLDLIPLDRNSILINGLKLELANPDISKYLTIEEQWKYRKYHGFVRGLYGFSYPTDANKIVDMINQYRTK